MRSKKEIKFAQRLSAEGLEFLTNVKNLPGTPDILFPKERLVVFFHGCFWHGHHCREEPASFEWKDKIVKIKASDALVQTKLRSNGYRVLVLYECEVDENVEWAIERILTRLSIAQLQ